MKNYNTYSTEDFVQEPYFRRWVLGRLPATDTFWETWLKAHPEQHDRIEEARNLILALVIEDVPPVADDEIRAGIDRILADTDSAKVRPVPVWKWVVAASVTLVLLSAGIWYGTRKAPAFERLATGETRQINQGSQPMVILLSDGSKVTLERNSQLRVGKGFGENTREVYLTGEAFFEVTRNPAKPFLVYTGKMVTRVLGTSFRVKAYATDPNISVSVRTGQVMVSRQAAPAKSSAPLAEQVVLLPNQQAVFLKEENRLVKTLVSKPVLLTGKTKTPDFNFEGTAIPQVFMELEKAYGIRIIFDPDLLADCNLTASLENTPLFEQLDLICETIQARYEIMDGHVVIYGKGCQ